MSKAKTHNQGLMIRAFNDGYEKGKADAIEEFHKTKIDVLNWLIKRQQEGYGTTNGELLDYIYDYQLKEENK